MRYRALSSTGDYRFGGSGQFLIDNKEAVAQAIMTRLKLIAGEWFLDVNEGTPYFERIFGYHTQGSRDAALRERILGTPGVKEITSYASALDSARRFTVSAKVETIYGPVTINTTT